MALNNVTFTNTPGGLGRLPVGQDFVSAILISLGATPSGWTNAAGKKYSSLKQAESDGIVESDADFTILWYQIREFFRVSGAAELYIADAAQSGFDAQAFFDLTAGAVRQAYWIKEVNYAGIIADIGTTNTFAVAMAGLNAPLSFIVAVKDETTAVSASLPDVATANSQYVSLINFGDGDAKGAAIADSLGINYIPAGGAVLGQIAKSKVSESIAWVQNANLAGSSELRTPVLSDGQRLTQVNPSILEDMDDKHYVFARQLPGQIDGTYLNDSLTCTSATSDFAKIENVRSYDKARRVLYAAYLLRLNGPIQVDDDGKVSGPQVKVLETVGERPMDAMVNAEELSGYGITIDPDQDVLSTSSLDLQVDIQPVGVANNIAINLSYTVTIA